MPKKFVASPTQAAFLASKARLVAFLAGLGAGKTAIGAIKALQKVSNGKNGIVVAPNFPHFAKSTWPELRKWLPWSRVLNKHLEHPYTQKKQLLIDAGGGKVVSIRYGGIDEPGSWRGPTANWFWYDECGVDKTREAFDVLCGRIREGESPQGWVTTTPSGRMHWLYDIFVRKDFPPEFYDAFKSVASNYGGKLVEKFHCSTSENVHNDTLYYASLLAMYQGKFKEQEIDGLFISLEGLVWEDFRHEPVDGNSNVTLDADYVPGVPVEWWCDDGYTRKHPRVILMVQEIPPYINVFAEYSVIYEKAEVSIQNALNMGYPKPPVAYCDSSAAEFMSRLEDEEIDTVGATHKIEEGIKHSAPFILSGEGVRHLRFHPRCTQSPPSIAAYSRNIKTNKPGKLGDDYSDCIRYGLVFKDLLDLLEEAKYQKKKADERRTGIPVDVEVQPQKGFFGL